MKILVATEKPFAPAAISQVKEIIIRGGHEPFTLEQYKDVQELRDAVNNIDALIVRSDIVDKDLISSAPNLKIVVRAGAGYDNLDLDACTEHNIVAMNTPGQNSNAVAELAFAMMLYLARGGFNGKTGFELKEKTIGLHAFGNVARHMARIAQGFGMKVMAFDPFVDTKTISDAGVVAAASLDDLYSKCQYISLHIPSNENTRKSVGAKLLSQMPQGAVLVNTARKEIIDEEELLSVMEQRTDFSYISDVTPDNAALFAEKYAGRYYFTPKKMGAQTKEANINALVAAANQIVNYFATGNESFRVNK